MDADLATSGFLSTDDLDCLISLLNDSLLDEVLEERVLRHFCCNLTASCPEPAMSDELISVRKAAQSKASRRSIKDLTQKLKARSQAASASSTD